LRPVLFLSDTSWTLPVVAAALLGFAVVSQRLEGTSLTPAIAFTAVGLAISSDALGMVDFAPTAHVIKVLAEATLTVVLFADAARVDPRALREQYSLPARLLGIGLPLTIVLGTLVGVPLLGGLSWPEVLLIAVILAPTDAALGQAVVTDAAVPARIRLGLNVESGLNDGICVPLFYIVLAIASADAGDHTDTAAGRLVVEQLGLGALAGAAAGAAAALLLAGALRRQWIGRAWQQVVPLAAAGLAYGAAAAMGGSGFIAAFVAGAVFGGIRRDASGEIDELLEETGGILSAVTFIAFGAVVLEPAFEHMTTAAVVYAVLSLTVIRMLPVALSVIGMRARRETVLFLGWFGPRGLASIVFAVLATEDGPLPHLNTVLDVIALTVALSVVAHGVTAAPLARRYGAWFARHPREAPPEMESRPAHHVRWRRLHAGRHTGSAL
jgi:NhaP-type Na+/H+ or K+/H+ antiporter